MALYKKIVLVIFVLAFLVMSVVPVCGLNDSLADISASPSIVNPGDEITVTYSGAPGFEFDWIGLYKVGDPNELFDWGYYLGGEKSGSLIIIAPQEPGDYDFRLFEDDGYTDIARSNIVTVQEGTTVSTPTPTPTTPSEGGLVGYWNFNEGSGNIAYDSSGSGNDGTIHGATFVSGISGQALSFDGKDDYVQVPDSPSLDITSNNITLSAWVYFPEFVPDYGTVIEKTGSGGWNSYGVFSKNDKLSFWLYTESIEAHTAVSANQWVHFVATYDGINMKIYINGALDVEREQPGIDIKENNMPLMIGADPFDGGDYCHILIDEVKIYNYALSADEIKAHYEEKEPSAPTPTPPPIDGEEAPVTVLTSSTILPTAGGLLKVESEDNELNGASLDIPARALTDNVMISIATTEDLPSGSPFGQVPLGKLFVLLPSDLTFSEPVTLTLPIPAGEERQCLYIGRWDEKNKIWENIGGTIDGDFIATNISHLSFYGVFYTGKSTVQIVNRQQLDTSDLPITVMYVAGPVPPPDTPDQSHFRATRPLPPGGVQLKQDESRIMQLLPGRYHFLVSYPRPQPGVANSMWFTIPVLTEGADDGQIDQTIAIRDYGADSTNTYTNDSIMFPGRTVVESTNFRPVVNCNAIVPEGVPLLGTNQILNIGPIKIEHLQNEGITLSATVTDPEGSALKYYWTVPTGVSIGCFTSGTTASGSTLTAQFKTGRAGIYTVYLTIYDQYGLFNEGRWVILVSPNAKPYIDVIVDDVVIDFGRLDDKRRNYGVGSAPGLPRNHPVPFPNVNFLPTPGIPNWGVYSAPPVQGEVSASTELKRLATLPDPAHVDPTQYPGGMTCVYAIVADADADLIDAKFVLPTPLFGRGNFYTAIPLPDYPIGTLIDSYGVMVNYNAMLTEYANRGWLPCQPHVRSAGSPPRLAPFVAPIESLRTPPREFPYVIAFNQGSIRNGSINPGDIVTEAPNPLGLIPLGTVFKVIVVEGSWTDGDAKGYLWLIPVTNDFWDPRHAPPPRVPTLFVNGVQKAICSYVGQTLPVIWEAPDDPDVEQTTHDRRHVFDPSTIISRGGTVNIEARVKDPFSPQERAFGLVAFPEKETVYGGKYTFTVTPNPADPGPNQSVMVTVQITPADEGITVDFSIVGTDGYSDCGTDTTNEDGIATFSIPGAEEGTVDVVTVTVLGITSKVTYTF